MKPGIERRSHRWLVVLSLILVTIWLGAGFWGCRGKTDRKRTDAASDPTPVTWQNRSETGFVGSQACKSCHESIWNSYQGHPMAEAMVRSDEASNWPEHHVDSLVFSTPAYLEYRIDNDGEQLVHHERLVGSQGETLVEQSEPIAFAMGSGTRGRSYILERDGELFMSPISWYSSDHKWDLSPGYLPVDHQQFTRPIADRCLRCHCGQPAASVGGTPEVPAYEEPIVLETGISCERCHGPGAGHIAFHETPSQRKNLTDPIVNPVDLAPQQRDDVCNQCHLQAQVEVLRYGRLPGDFRPGDSLGDIWSVFVSGTDVQTDQTTKAVSHVQQMQSSRCYQQSNRALGCVTCHDPHGRSAPEERIIEVRQACLECHASGDCSEPMTVRNTTTPIDNCVACHMPSLSAHDVPHTTQTDHRLLKNPSAIGDSKPESETMIETGPTDWALYEADTANLSQPEVDRALGIAMLRDAERGGNLLLFELAREKLAPLENHFPGDTALLEALALAYYRLDQPKLAIAAWNKVLETDARHEEALLNLGTLHQNEGELGKARDFLERFVEVRPHNLDGLYRLSLVKGQLLQIDEAIELAERAKDLNPRRWEIYHWLIELYRDSGQDALAEPLQKILDQVSQKELRQ